MKKKAAGYWSQLAKLTRQAEGERAELVELKQHMAKLQ
jgi:hypothetical protein